MCGLAAWYQPLTRRGSDTLLFGLARAPHLLRTRASLHRGADSSIPGAHLRPRVQKELQEDTTAAPDGRFPVKANLPGGDRAPPSAGENGLSCAK